MAQVRTFRRSFAGGEVTPEFFSQIEDAKFQTGLATCRNFFVKPHGPVENRPGTEFVRAAKHADKAARLIPFTYSTTQTMALEFGDEYIRFHTAGATLLYSDGAAWLTATAYVVGDIRANGGQNYYCAIAHTSGTHSTDLAAGKWYLMPSDPNIYEIPSPYAEADLFAIHYTQSADVLTLVHPGYAPRELRRYGATDWRLVSIAFVQAVSAPSVTVRTNAKGTSYFYQYVVTSVDADGNESEASSPGQGPTGKIISGVTKASPGVITTSSAHGLVVGNACYIDRCTGMTELNGNYYVVGTTPTTTTLTLTDAGGNAIDTTSYGTYTGTAGRLYQAGVLNNLFATGGANTITWTPVTDADTYNVYKFQGGLYGYIGQTAGTSFIDDNIAPDLSKTPPIYESAFSATGDYPGAVGYYEQRRVFAGTDNDPQKFWMTRSGSESNMSYSLPVQDSDRIAFRVAAREANTIRHVVPLAELLLLTSAAEWRVTSVNSDAITPSTTSVKPQSYVGASDVQPAIINNTMIYVAARGGHVREAAYSWQAGGYITGDLSLRAPHLFDGLDVVDMAYAKAPYPMVFAVSSSGDLLASTYVPEQQVGAWHWHDTYGGAFESCAVVAEGSEDALYVIVRRTIDGATVRYVERLHARAFTGLSDCWFVDCGGQYSGAATNTVTGADWLEGCTVSILADGAVIEPQVVTSGAFSLPDDIEAETITFGLPITADIETLPIAVQVDNAFGQGRYKNVNKAVLRVYQSSGILVGPNAAQLTRVKARTSEPYGTPPALRTGEIDCMTTPAWADGGQVFVRQTDPLPLTVVSITAEVSLGG